MLKKDNKVSNKVSFNRENILAQIVADKQAEVAAKKRDYSLAFLQAHPNYSRSCHSLAAALKGSQNGIIAEFKRQSPSKGIINSNAQPAQVVQEYAQAGVAASSVLTDYKYFGGCVADLEAARNANPNLPLLRKDFLVDAYQIYESKAVGADVILLIASYLTAQQLQEYYEIATSLGLSVLHEVHSPEELDKIELDNKIIGVNNRNLKTFKVDLAQSIALAKSIPDNCLKVAESGIHDLDNFLHLKAEGFQGFLIGENFMKTDNPGQACQEFVQNLYKKEQE